MMTLTHVVPRPGGLDGGVFAFAQRLACAIQSHVGIRNRLLLVGDEPHSPPQCAGVEAELMTAGSAAALTRGLGEEPGAALVHYANYGYARRGCPAYLASALEGWKRRCEQARVVTYFHEVFATGAPWHSSFWLAPLQRSIARRVARASDGLVTSLELYASFLRPWAEGKPVLVEPVFSTIGEPDTLVPLAHRRRRLVIFGGGGTRERAYGELRQSLELTCRVLEIAEVIDIGPPLEMMKPELGVGALRCLGKMPAGGVGEILAGSVAGFLAYPPSFLSKSTVFAAYCAHGVLPVCAWHRQDAGGDLRPGEHYWRPTGEETADWTSLARIAERARAWYRRHDLRSQVRLLAPLLALPETRLHRA